MPTSNTATNWSADARVAPKYSRRAFGLLVPGLLLTLAGCSVAHADSATPEAAPTSRNTPTPRPKATSAPTSTPPPSPTSTPGLATVVAGITPKPTQPGVLPSQHRLPPERVVIPRIGIDSKVVRIETKLDAAGDRVWETAAFAVGHHRGSANPGERGNVVLSGHISSIREGAVFKRLPEIVAGDGVVLLTAEQNYLYKVTRLQTVTPDHLEALAPTEDETVTLITCVPDGVYTHRLIVTAKRVQPPPEVRG